MTKYKKELRKAGFKLEQDFPFLPYQAGTVPTLEAIVPHIRKDHIEIAEVYVVGIYRRWIGKDLKEDITKSDFE